MSEELITAEALREAAAISGSGSLAWRRHRAQQITTMLQTGKLKITSTPDCLINWQNIHVGYLKRNNSTNGEG